MIKLMRQVSSTAVKIQPPSEHSGGVTHHSTSNIGSNSSLHLGEEHTELVQQASNNVGKVATTRQPLRGIIACYLISNVGSTSVYNIDKEHTRIKLMQQASNAESKVLAIRKASWIQLEQSACSLGEHLGDKMRNSSNKKENERKRISDVIKYLNTILSI